LDPVAEGLHITHWTSKDLARRGALAGHALRFGYKLGFLAPSIQTGSQTTLLARQVVELSRDVEKTIGVSFFISEKKLVSVFLFERKTIGIGFFISGRFFFSSTVTVLTQFHGSNWYRFVIDVAETCLLRRASGRFSTPRYAATLVSRPLLLRWDSVRAGGVTS
jgi:hypothetical protein